MFKFQHIFNYFFKFHSWSNLMSFNPTFVLFWAKIYDNISNVTPLRHAKSLFSWPPSPPDHGKSLFDKPPPPAPYLTNEKLNWNRITCKHPNNHFSFRFGLTLLYTVVFGCFPGPKKWQFWPKKWIFWTFWKVTIF